MTRPDIDAIKARYEATTGHDWHWAGNTDSGEPYLATWVPGAGRCIILGIGTEDRAKTGRRADEVRSYALDCGLDPEEFVEEWATDRYGEPIQEPRLQFMTDLMCVNARDHVVYEVAPGATSRDDKRVYRADITGIRHPDAEFIVRAHTDIPALLAYIDKLETRLFRSLTRYRQLQDRVDKLEAERAAPVALPHDQGGAR